MSSPPYTTIPWHSLHTASTGLTFLHQRTIFPPPYTTIPLHTAHCVHWFDLFAQKNNVPTTIYHYSTAYCILWFDLFAPKTMSPPSYTTILLCTASTASSGLTFLYQRQCPHHHIPLFYCVHCVLCPHHRVTLL